jgi:hypothetical protein
VVEPPGGNGVVIVVIAPRTLSLTTMFVRVTLPQLVTTPLTVFVVPTSVADPQILVTAMHGDSVTAQIAVAVFVIFCPQTVVPRAVTVLVLFAQPAVKDLL